MNVRPRRARWMAIACLFLLTLPAVATRPHSADEIEYFSFLRSLWFDRDLSFENEYRYFYEHGFITDPGFKDTFIDPLTPTGHRRTFATIGAAILWTPFYAIADAGVRVVRVFGSDVAADGFSRPYLTAVAWGSACYGFLALLLSGDLARRLTGRGWGAATAIALGTPLIYYMYAQPGFAHAASAFSVAVFVWIWMRVRATWSLTGVALLGALAALMTMVREQEAFIVIAPAVDYAWTLAGRRDAPRVRGAVQRFLVAAAAFAVCFLPQVLSYLAINGHIGPSPVVANKMNWTAPWATRVLWSPEHGWFFWTPLATVAIAGLIVMIASPRRDLAGNRRVGIVLLIALATQVYVSGSVATWTLAGAFGQRRFVGITICLVVGLGALWAHFSASRHGRALMMCLVALCVWWNLALAVQFGAHTMDRQKLEPRRNAYGTFIELPMQLPSLAYRYFFDRASFYRSRAAGE